MKKLILIFALALAALPIMATNWTNYPYATPNTNDTFLFGSISGKTNYQWSVGAMLNWFQTNLNFTSNAVTNNQPLVSFGEADVNAFQTFGLSQFHGNLQAFGNYLQIGPITFGAMTNNNGNFWVDPLGFIHGDGSDLTNLSASALPSTISVTQFTFTNQYTGWYGRMTVTNNAFNFFVGSTNGVLTNTFTVLTNGVEIPTLANSAFLGADANGLLYKTNAPAGGGSWVADHCILYSTNAQTFTSPTTNLITFTTATNDNDNISGISTNSVICQKVGWYRVFFQMTLNNSSFTSINVFIYINGVEVTKTLKDQSQISGGEKVTVEYDGPLNAGDWVNVYAYPTGANVGTYPSPDVRPTLLFIQTSN